MMALAVSIDDEGVVVGHEDICHHEGVPGPAAHLPKPVTRGHRQERKEVEKRRKHDTKAKVERDIEKHRGEKKIGHRKSQVEDRSQFEKSRRVLLHSGPLLEVTENPS